MCRLFGFRSIITSQVHRSLISSENALLSQSNGHPDGWGVAYYQGDCPHVVKSTSSAFADSLFTQVSGVVSSNTVVAHLRKATAGEKVITNTHPFQFGRWIFAHNGNIKDFDLYRDELYVKVSPKLRPFILGQTDSELIFFLILSHLERRIDIHRTEICIEDIFASLDEALSEILSVIGPMADEGAPFSETFLTFILTNGFSLAAFHGGMPLNYSTYKSRCSVRGTCPHLSQVCEAPSKSGYVNHFIVASERLQGENIFIPLKKSTMVGVDSRMMMKQKRLGSQSPGTSTLRVIGEEVA